MQVEPSNVPSINGIPVEDLGPTAGELFKEAVSLQDSVNKAEIQLLKDRGALEVLGKLLTKLVEDHKKTALGELFTE